MSPSDAPVASTEPTLEIISGGATGLVKLRANSPLVEKAPYPYSEDAQQSIRDLNREFIAYKRLPLHPRLLQLHPDSTPEKLVLPYLHHGCLHQFLRAPFDISSPTPSSPGSLLRTPPPPMVTPLQRLQFAADAAEGVSVLHSAGIVHGDINAWNFLLDDEFRLCIIDFSGSTFDGVRGSALEGYRYCLPRPFKDPSTVRTDLFALGSVLYEIATGEAPYQRCEDEEAVELFEQGIFPSVKEFQLGSIILGCWQGVYSSALSVFEDIQAQQSNLDGDGDGI
ncbi:serine/threonine protein kinase [Zymoseptoria brevis]|uniref:Serine/threonine protein kinase n=1 Tax=Zymoseptoria brevis TaxID=1047168 RepID=A0A0F4GNM2_9PEZI|nr:serine/threonine protein kinase [Zymoseptoria brevis]